MFGDIRVRDGEAGSTLRAHEDRRLGLALGRVGRAVSRLTIFLEDLNAREAEGPALPDRGACCAFGERRTWSVMSAS